MQEEKKIIAWMAFFIGNCVWYINEQPMPEEKYIPCSKLPFKDKEIRRIFYGDENNDKCFDTKFHYSIILTKTFLMILSMNDFKYLIISWNGFQQWKWKGHQFEIKFMILANINLFNALTWFIWHIFYDF